MNNDIDEMFKQEVKSLVNNDVALDDIFEMAYEELKQYDWNHSSNMYPIIEKYYDTIDYGKLTYEIINLHIGFGTYEDYALMLARVNEESSNPKKAIKMAMIHHYILMYCSDLIDLDEYKMPILNELVETFFENNEYDEDESINKIMDDAEEWFICDFSESTWETKTLNDLIVEKHIKAIDQ